MVLLPGAAEAHMETWRGKVDAGGVLIFVLYSSAGPEVSALLGGCILQKIVPKSAGFPRKRRFGWSRRGLPHLLWIGLGFLHLEKHSS